ncbi:YdcF family protein [Lactiplantibacillus pentosus]|uniref:YdcF family protein n=1 Tax=Lactiplantibacillus pentosus TaxID=1589 RepID=UPI0015980C36|nr:YdcF family protein [Lactiplantibacillus pentosus]MCH4130232.1 YdcF family protein [Lactiplantibacillus sp.]MCT3292122.1 YdcF family protein [Lactiplantibacillus pentosus]BBM21969.1 S-adenosyl-L-methionine binding protein [Lactiplantibacillus plantarum]
MDELTAFNRCLDWLTQAVAQPTRVDGLVLCGNSLPASAIAAGQLAQHYQLPTVIIAGGVGHATKYLRHNLDQPASHASEAALMATLIRQTGYTGELRLDETSTNTGSNATHARDLAPANWRHVLLIQDPLLARRTELTFAANWDGVDFTRYLPTTLQLSQLEPLRFKGDTTLTGWQPAYFTELLLGEFQRLADTPTGYGPRGQGFIAHVDIPEDVLAAVADLQSRALRRQR